VGKFAAFNKRPKAKSVSASEGSWPPWPGALFLDLDGGSVLRPRDTGFTIAIREKAGVSYSWRRHWMAKSTSYWPCWLCEVPKLHGREQCDTIASAGGGGLRT